MKLDGKKFALLCLLVVLNGCAAAMALKAAMGIAAYDAWAQTLAEITGLKVGTWGIIMNCLCVGGEFILLKKKFGLLQLLQIPVCLLLGTVVNFVLYDVLTFSLDTYFSQIVLFVAAYVLMGFIIGAIMALDVITFPLEGFCKLFAAKRGLDFAKVRQGVDVLFIVLSVVLALVASVPMVVREGTLIAMLMFAPIMNFSMKLCRSHLENRSKLALQKA